VNWSPAVTTFASDQDPNGKPLVGNFFDYLSRPLPRSVPKKSLPMWSLTTFDGPRRAANARFVAGVVLDVDVQPVPTLETLRQTLSTVYGFVTSSSSSTPGTPRWRLGLFTDKPIPAKDYKRIGHHLVKKLPFVVATNSIEPARAWYAPREPEEGPYVFEILPGALLSLDRLLLEAPAVEKDITIRDDILPPALLSPEELAYHRWHFEKYCTETNDVGTKVAARAYRYDLPIEVAAEIIERIYAPRCAALVPPQPWYRENIFWKLEQVYSGMLHADIALDPQGPSVPPPDSFFDKLKGLVSPEEAAAPQILNPQHTYSYEAGMRLLGESRRGTFNELQADLFTNRCWAGVLSYDTFHQMVFATNPPMKMDAETSSGLSDADVDLVRSWFEFHGKRFSKDDVRSGLEIVARRRSFNPVQDWLRSRRWDGVARLDRVLPDFFGTADGEYELSIGPRWFISLVARAMTPGCQADCTLVLEGPQGIGKTSAFRALMADPTWYAESSAGVESKDFLENLRGVWLMGFDELDSLTRRSLTKVKTVLTALHDKFRKSYGHYSSTYPRTCGFCGSTNEEQYFNDPTGARRFWPARVKRRINIPMLIAARDLLWAEAYVRWQAGEEWHVNTPELLALCETEQEQRLEVDAWEEAVREWLGDPTKVTRTPAAAVNGANGANGVNGTNGANGLTPDLLFKGGLRPYDASNGITTAAVLERALGKLKGQWTLGDSIRVARLLRRMGFERIRVRTAGLQEWRYLFPDGENTSKLPIEAQNILDLRNRYQN